MTEQQALDESVGATIERSWIDWTVASMRKMTLLLDDGSKMTITGSFTIDRVSEDEP